MTSLPAIEETGNVLRGTIDVSAIAMPAPAASTNGPSFEAELGNAGRSEPSIGERFEASALTSFLGAMLPSDDAEVWGGSAGAMWKGVYAERLAESVARSGGIGIAAMIDGQIEKMENGR